MCLRQQVPSGPVSISPIVPGQRNPCRFLLVLFAPSIGRPWQALIESLPATPRGRAFRGQMT